MPAASVFLRRFTVSGLLSVSVVAASAFMVAGLMGDASEAQADTAKRNFSSWNNVQQTAPTITYVAQGMNLPPMLNSMSEQLLQDAISRYEIIASRGGWPMIPGGQRLSKGGQGELVGLLRQRLAIEGYSAQGGAEPYRFDAGLQAAVVTFQKNHGLAATGVVDQETINALNVPVEGRLVTMRANLPRMREYAKGLTDRYITINIPATQLETVENGMVYSVHNVVAGMTDRPSPVVLSRVSDITFNPYWIAPASIVKKDIIPKAQKDPGFLIEQRIRIHDGLGGPEIDPMSIDWNTLNPERYVFRQDPGDDNAMATVKIHFPNKYAVYMHDTPTRSLFSSNERYFSSGCVRIDQVHIVTEWLLRPESGWGRSRIEQVIASGENTKVDFTQTVAVRMVYMTAWATPEGYVNFRPDIYQLDGIGFVSGQPEPLGKVAEAPPQQQSAAYGQPAPIAVSAPGQAPVGGARDAWRRESSSNRQINQYSQ